MDVINRVLTFWFEENFEECRKAWFIKSADFDFEIKTKFGDDVKKASAEVYDIHAQTPEGALALMILLDQFLRNMSRGDPKSFATDSKALRIAKQTIANGLDIDLTVVQRFFLPAV
jgi:uncharacterized protein (DUF924 family)